MRDFRNLTVWGKAQRLSLTLYRCTEQFPKTELFGLTSQLKRASSSITANIAEGCGRHSRWEYVHFLDIALGSASEVQCELTLAADLGFIDKAAYARLSEQVAEVKRMLTALVKKTRNQAAETR
jgi:four helix bundle protein